jgi:hypothetical protein
LVVVRFFCQAGKSKENIAAKEIRIMTKEPITKNQA